MIEEESGGDSTDSSYSYHSASETETPLSQTCGGGGGGGGGGGDPGAMSDAADFIKPKFRCLCAESLRPSMLLPIKDVARLTGLTQAEAELALHSFNWRLETLMDAWLSGEGAARARLGLRGGADPPSLPSPLPSELAFCPVTLEDCPWDAMDALPCGHWFSRAAWTENLAASLGTDPFKAQLCRCLAFPHCTELVRLRMYEAYLPPDLLQRWKDFGVRRYAAASRHIAFCPGQGCSYAVFHTDLTRLAPACKKNKKERSCLPAHAHAHCTRHTTHTTHTLPSQRAPRVAEDVTCLAGHSFCFGCVSPVHAPATCAEMESWRKRDTAEGADALWIMQNTKSCPNPKCGRAIERSTGCNKVICSACSTAMCYACGLEYYKEAGHTYPQGAWTCNKPPAASRGAGSSKEADDLLYFGHFAQRAATSAQSSRLSAKEAPGVAKAAEDICALLSANALLNREVGRAGLGLEYCKEANAMVTLARDFLRHSYVHSYALAPGSNESNLFCDQQSYLEGTVERLQELVVCSALVRLRQDVDALLKGKAVGVKGGGGGGGGASSAGSSSSAAAAVGGGAGGAAEYTGVEGAQQMLQSHRMRVLALSTATSTFMRGISESIKEGSFLLGAS